MADRKLCKNASNGQQQQDLTNSSQSSNEQSVNGVNGTSSNGSTSPPTRKQGLYAKKDQTPLSYKQDSPLKLSRERDGTKRTLPNNHPVLVRQENLDNINHPLKGVVLDCHNFSDPGENGELQNGTTSLDLAEQQNGRIVDLESGRVNSDTEAKDKKSGILVYRKYSEPELAVMTSPPIYRRDFGGSLDLKDSMLEIYDDDEDEDSKIDPNKPKVPDGGWGWVVVLASLVISMIADGVSFSFGLLYIEFLRHFGASKSKTAWIGSLFMAVPLLSGPMMSALVDRYGCRKMTIAGGFISGLGFVLSSFSDTIEVMYLTFGVLAGLGLGLCYVTAVVSIAYWFDKKRTLAVGLGACGTGIGTFVYAPMTTFFINEYGWRGTCLLLAGTFFNMIVCGSVMRDPEWWIAEQKKQLNSHTPRKVHAISEAGRSTGSPIEEFPGVEELRKLLKSGNAPEYLLQSITSSTEAPSKGSGPNSLFRSVVNLPTFVNESEKVLFFFS